jgi:hypothetical protein
MSPTNLSRRVILPGAASVPALALPAAAAVAAPTTPPPAVAVPLLAEPDPIFAAIEKYRAAWAKFGAAIHDASAYEEKYGVEDHPRLRKLRSRANGAGVAASRAGRMLCLAVPTTIAGAAAMVRLAEERGEELLTIHMSKYVDDGTSGGALMTSLRKGLDGLAADASGPDAVRS